MGIKFFDKVTETVNQTDKDWLARVGRISLRNPPDEKC
jgi:hypothetical protein